MPGQSCHCDGLGPTGGSWVGEGGAGKCGAFRVWRRWDELGALLAWRWADRLSCSPKLVVCPAKMLRAIGFPSASEQKERWLTGKRGGKVRSELFSHATGRKEEHIDEMKCRLQIADYRLHKSTDSAGRGKAVQAPTHNFK